MAPVKILAVDDDPAIRTLIHRYLSQQNYQVESAGDGKTALELFNKFSPDLVVLDVNLPDTTGFQLCKKMQSNTNVFVLMLTSLADEDSKLHGFKEGADDYITKPFGLVELGARVGAILKRQRLVSNSQPEGIQLGNLTIDPHGREVKINGELIALTALEFDILYCLAGKPGRAWKRSDLIQEVWDYEYMGDERVVDVHIGQIRKKLENSNDNSPKIKTVRGIGYKLDV
ncbi:MAG: response regulator transcription factor [Okeania sp. SIO2C2]|uniref:response regulator transcription factor n=1 Tax=unclassified Okeania TaxID=2634635 RepID=UPI0013BA7815|nr:MULTISPECIES: response regulator transcription factor [unclassified Okeania]NEP04976.1 response regulator transcription factor [Okeania sp. SIO4D6]NEP70624.1 response regulator transcription factor [Okeania sp. SIO2G5]NEP90842.1 response regulator transcription factor [Okeania sp. SIO2C2]NEP91868.1 response regulator transcription factor [Okeania sp. SIO2F5]NEQ89292.1 response regulator transcription factor [Okeania sp. SIO2G4]